MEQAIFAAGCFWGVQVAFAKLKGVIQTRVGFTGGQVEDPTYEQVCAGKTGHAEAIEVIYDPEKITYEELLDTFFMSHNPTQLNRQGNDIGEQYRSAIFYSSERQKNSALAAVERHQDRFSDPIVTLVVPSGEFYEAEEYHQNYYKKKGMDK